MKKIHAFLVGSLLVGVAGAQTVSYSVNQQFRDRCDSLVRPTSQLVVPSGVTCVSQEVGGTVYVANNRNGDVAGLELAGAICKAAQGESVDLSTLTYGCQINKP